MARFRHGIPQAGNQGRFQYTGQMWLPEIGLYNYKARMYSPTLGRFLQTDPIGYGDGPNMYDYVGGDPANKADPSGLYLVQMCKLQPVTVTLEEEGKVNRGAKAPTLQTVCWWVEVGRADSTVTIPMDPVPVANLGSSVTVKLPPARPSPPGSKPPPQLSSRRWSPCRVLPSSVTYGRVATAEGAVALRGGPLGLLLGISSVKDGIMGEIVHNTCE